MQKVVNKEVANLARGVITTYCPKIHKIITSARLSDYQAFIIERAWTLNEEAMKTGKVPLMPVPNCHTWLVATAAAWLASWQARCTFFLLPPSLVRPSNRITLPPPLFWPHLSSALLSLQTQSKANLMSALRGKGSEYRQSPGFSSEHDGGMVKDKNIVQTLYVPAPSGQSTGKAKMTCAFRTLTRALARGRRGGGGGGYAAAAGSLPALLSLAHSNRAPRGKTPVAQREKESISKHSLR